MLLITCVFWGQTNKLSIIQNTVIDENINELNTKQSEYLYNKIIALFNKEGFEVNHSGFVTIIPKLSKISNIESNDIYEKTMIVRFSLNIHIKNNSTTIAIYEDELAGSGSTINEATLYAIDKLGELGEKEKFKKFIINILKSNNEIQSNNPVNNKLANTSGKSTVYKVQNGGDTVVNQSNQNGNVIINPVKENWLEKFLNNTNNLLGVIGSIAAFLLFLWRLKMNNPENQKKKKRKK